jgi:hypothetical protein
MSSPTRPTFYISQSANCLSIGIRKSNFLYQPVSQSANCLSIGIRNPQLATRNSQPESPNSQPTSPMRLRSVRK